MISKKTILLLFLGITGCNERVNKESKSSKHPIVLAMDQKVDSLILNSNLSSLAIGIFKNGETYMGYYGELDKGMNNMPNDETLFEIASITKTFTGILIAQAEIEGRLSIEDNVQKFLNEKYPNLEYGGNPIRVKDIITHTSGLPLDIMDGRLLEGVHMDSVPYNYNRLARKIDKKTFLNGMHKYVIDTIPGYKYSYSNAGYELLAHVLENIYNQPYEQLLAEKIYQKTGIENTKVFLKEEEQKLANGYNKNGKLVAHFEQPLWGAAGGLKSTLPDMMKYIAFQMAKNNPVISKTHQLITYDNNRNFKSGYFWTIDSDDVDGTYFYAGGAAFGTRTWLFLLPKHNIGMALITNKRGVDGALFHLVNSILGDIR